MASIALFHSVLGVRPGIHDAADRLRAGGHEVLVVDQFEGRVFDDYAEAGRHTEQLGFPELMRRAEAAVEPLPDGFVAAGFSNGAGMAEHVALRRRCSGVLLFSGALPPEVLGASGWPARTPVQLHYATGDPMRHQEWVAALAAAVRASGSSFELHDHPGTGHLFTDPSLPGEHDPRATELLWQRALAFLGSVAPAPGAAPATAPPT